MRKITIIFALLLIFALIGCANDEPPEQGSAYEPTKPTFNPEATPTETPTHEPVEPSVTEPPGLTPERELQIRENFVVWLYEGCENPFTLDHVLGVEHFGTFDSYEVIYMHASTEVLPSTTGETIAGYDFMFPYIIVSWDEHVSDQDYPSGGVHLWLHDDGEFMCICVGYERGYLTAEDIGVIWERYNDW